MNIRQTTSEDHPGCLDIARFLPEWFDDKEIARISKDLESFDNFVLEVGGIIKAFVVCEDKNEEVEILHLAVDRNEHGKGYGSALTKHIEKNYPNAKSIIVKTLDESVDYPPYESTRKFYEKNGFKKTEVIDDYPGWSPGNPCAVYVKINFKE